MSTTLIIILAAVALFLGLIVYNYYKVKNAPPVKNSDKIRVLNNKNFGSATRRGLVLVDFWAPWCGPCKMIAPVLNDIAEQEHGKLTIGKVNVDHNQQVASKFKIRSIPTMIVFKDGKEVKRITGFKPKKALLKEVYSAV